MSRLLFNPVCCPSQMFFLLLTLLTAPGVAQAQRSWSQKPERQPVLERGTSTDPETRVNAIADAAFSQGSVPKWIWGPDNNQKYVLRKSLTTSMIQAARLRASSDNVGTVFLNGRRVAGSSEWQEPMDADVTAFLKDGDNVLEAEVENQGGVAAFVLKLVVRHSNDQTTEIVTDESWTFSARRDDVSGDSVHLRGTYGDGPWGRVFDNVSQPGRIPAGTFEVLPGFQVEKLFTVPKEELGSWVCIAFDSKGRLLASDQGDKGICRITLPAPGAESAETLVEHLDFSNCDVKPTGAQGMLWAFDSLYFSINGGPGSGLYRARDTNNDDQFDECVRLKDFRGGGEHGPHALRLSPDGRRIFVIAGNHTQPPFNAGEEVRNPNFTSRIPTNWSEDHLLPRMWDANGHARGVLAPGGWIASTDADGKTWDIWSVGYRNPYDMAFNADGELFAYDADMEWDVGMPWYRPTRVVHATSGSEFGWRSGSGKWPNHYLDSLPPVVNIGPGSPVGVEFGYGLRFPAKYQKALYLCDWTFGTMYAIHLEPSMSSYRAAREEFLSRSPLPLTDVVSGQDGALYFSVGGRGTQSELYRVIYTGEESTAPAELRDSSQAGARSHRRSLEAAHAGVGPNGRQSPLDAETFLNGLSDNILSGDRFIRTASRNAFYHSALFDQVIRPGVLRESDFSGRSPDEVFAVAVALAKAPLYKTDVPEADQPALRSELQSAALRALRSLTWSALATHHQLDYLRSLSLVFLRLGEPDDAVRQEFIRRLDDSFPAADDELNRELCQMLVYLQSPTVIARTVELLNAPAKSEDTPDGDRLLSTDEITADLLARNRGYGGAIRASLESAPDLQQIWYAFCLRNLKDGWTMDQRKAYFAWFERAHTWAGGASFHGFLRNIEQEAFENAGEKERLLIEASGARKPYSPPEIPKPDGPGKDWTLEEVREMAREGLRRRDFENGQKMFAATRCVICHRFAGDGGATGPDLTQLAGRFNLNDLTEAIMDPSKVISDQYKASTVVTTSGQSYSGRIVAENDDRITILTSPEDPTKITEILKNEIDEIQPSAVSIMPADLLKPLNRNEVLDLLAYLLSRGDKRDAMFRK